MNVLNFESKLCERTRRQLDAYLSSELMVETTGEVARHLENCAGCASELESRMRVRSALRQAALRQTPPPALSQAIHDRLRRSQPGALVGFRLNTWALAVAATVIVMIGGTGGQHLLRQRRERQAVKSILALGVSDHVDCALREHNYPDTPRSAEQLRQRLGPECAGLLPVVEEALPGFQVLEAHICSLPGNPRKYVHFIARGEGTILSIIFSQRDGRSLPEGGPLTPHSSSLYQARLQNVDVAGFQSEKYFGFVVSDLGQDRVIHIARDLAPPVREALDRLSTATNGTDGISKMTEAAMRL